MEEFYDLMSYSGNYGVFTSLVQSISSVGPMLNVIGLFSIIAGITGGYFFYSILFAFIITLLNIYMPFKASREIKSNGGYYTVSGLYAGKDLGFFTAIIYSFYGFLSLPSVTLFIFSILYFVLSNSFLALIITLMILLLEFLILSKGMNPTFNLLKFLTILEISMIIIMDILMISHGKSNMPVFRYRLAANLQFWGSMLFSLLMFAGLGSSLFISEEVKESKRNVSKGILGAYAVSGALMLLTASSLIMFLGKGIEKYASDPFFILNVIIYNFGPYVYYSVLIFAVISAFNLSLGYMNAWRNSIIKMHEDNIFRKIGRGNSLIIAFVIDAIFLAYFYMIGNEFLGFVIFTGLVSLDYLTVHLISNLSFMKHIKSIKKYTGMIILSISSLLLIMTVIYSSLGYATTNTVILAIYAAMLFAPIIILFTIRRSGYLQNIHFNYE